MGHYFVKKGNLKLQYGFDEQTGAWYYEVYDKIMPHGNPIDYGSTLTGSSNIEIAEKMKLFGCKREEIEKVIMFKPI